MRVPEGWVHTTFDKHTECLTGFAFKSINYSNNINDIRLLRGDNIEPNALRWRDAKYWDKAELINLQKYLLLEGDFVIALDRTWISNGLKVAEVRGIDIPCLLVQRVVRIRTKPTLAQGLLKHYFSGYKFEQYVKSVQTATAVPHISPNDIKEFPVLLPPLPEQQKIAQILSTWDKAITTTEQLLFNSQQQKKALMQQLLTGKKRLLDEDGVRFSDMWEHNILGKLIKEVKRDKEENPNEIELLTVKLHYKGAVRSGKYPNARERRRPYFKRFENELIIGRQNLHNGGVAIVSKNCDGLIASNAISSFENRKNVNVNFILSIMSTAHFRFLVDNLTGGTGQKEVSVGELLKMHIFAPNYEEQNKIATVLSRADREIKLLQTQLEALKQEKKALMQQLLTGKRRVKILEVGQ